MKLEQWQKNLYATWLAQFLALMGANLVFPFIPFFVKDLGVESDSAAALWSGVLATATGVTLFISSPLWGSLADRFGRKNMLLRAYAGATVTITLQCAVQTVWQLFVLRALQGAFVGTIPAATALIAAGTPARRMAYALGLIQMAVFTSQTVGPVVGGIMASAVGFRMTFALGGLMYIVSFVVCWIFVKEDFHRPDPSVARPSYVENLRSVIRVPTMLLLITVMFLVSSAAVFVRPVMPLLVESFTDSDVATKTASSSPPSRSPALSPPLPAAASPSASDTATRSSAPRSAPASPTPLVTFAGQLSSLMLLMALVGVFSGAMIPMVNALIGAAAPEGKHGSAFGLVGSAQALSFAVAPLLGGITAQQLGIHAGFAIVGMMLVAVSGLVWLTVREPASMLGPELVDPEPPPEAVPAVSR